MAASSRDYACSRCSSDFLSRAELVSHHHAHHSFQKQDEKPRNVSSSLEKKPISLRFIGNEVVRNQTDIFSHTEYQIEVSTQGKFPQHMWYIERRYSQIKELNSTLQLILEIKDKLPSFPSSKKIPSTSEDYREKMAFLLEKYLHDLLNIPNITSYTVLLNFFSSSFDDIYGNDAITITNLQKQVADQYQLINNLNAQLLELGYLLLLFLTYRLTEKTKNIEINQIKLNYHQEKLDLISVYEAKISQAKANLT